MENTVVINNTKTELERLQKLLQVAQAEAQDTENVRAFYEKGLTRGIQELLDKESPLVKEYGCKVIVDSCTGISGHASSSIIIRVPIPEAGDFYTTDVKIEIDRSTGLVSDISTGTLMTNLKAVPEKLRASGVAHELAVAANKRRLHIEKIEGLLRQFNQYPTKEATALQKVKDLEREIQLVKKYKEATAVLKKDFQENALPAFEKNKTFNAENLRKFLQEKGLANLRHGLGNLFNAAGNKQEIIENILDKLYV